MSTVYLNGVAVDAGAGDVGHKEMTPDITPRWVIPGWFVDVVGSVYCNASIIWYTPIRVARTTTYIRIGIHVLTLAVGTADLRIFAWNNGVPGALILSAGTVDTGTNGYKEIEIAQELTPGYYFLAIRCSGAPNLSGPDIDFAVKPPVSGFHDIGNPACNAVILYTATAFADPAPAPTAWSGPAHAFVSLREA